MYTYHIICIHIILPYNNSLSVPLPEKPSHFKPLYCSPFLLKRDFFKKKNCINVTFLKRPFKNINFVSQHYYLSFSI